MGVNKLVVVGRGRRGTSNFAICNGNFKFAKGKNKAIGVCYDEVHDVRILAPAAFPHYNLFRTVERFK